MNLRRGLLRTAIVASGAYFGFWAAIAYFADQSLTAAIADIDRSKPWDDPTNLAMMKMMNDANGSFQDAVNFGLFPFIALVAASPFVWWIYRGFVSERSE